MNHDMKLDINQWKEFRVSAVFTIHNGKGITKDEIEDNEGDFTVVQSGEENNGVLGKISHKHCEAMNYTFSDKPCLTVARSGSAGFVSFQIDGCVVGDSAKILLLDEKIASVELYVFLQTLLAANRYKYAYGRKVTESKYMNDIMKLPIKYNEDGTPFIDTSKKYSEEGYVPNWEWMENYIKSLHHNPVTTKNTDKTTIGLKTNEWEYFLLKDICSITMGNKMDYSAMSMDDPTIVFVGRSAENNGVAGKVDLVVDDKGDVIKPYKAGCVTVALGGSLGSAYLQVEDFYTSQNVAVLEFEDSVSDSAKLFITTCIMNESKYKYFPFGRELNTHIRTDFGFTLPIQCDLNREPIIDDTCKYSKKGYIPDWKWMENYIKALPYGDRI